MIFLSPLYNIYNTSCQDKIPVPSPPNAVSIITVVGWRLVFIDWPNLAGGGGEIVKQGSPDGAKRRSARGGAFQESSVSWGLLFRPTATKLTPERWVTAAFCNQPRASLKTGCQEIILAANYPNTFPDKPDFVSLFPYSRRLNNHPLKWSARKKRANFRNTFVRRLLSFQSGRISIQWPFLYFW